jgi:16S rRNA (cytosine967-C5)-methyltransferase
LSFRRASEARQKESAVKIASAPRPSAQAYNQILMPVSQARAAAFDILLRVERNSSYASELLHSSAYKDLSATDHKLATELVMGVLRWRSQLDNEIACASSQTLVKLDLEVLIALRLALYQFWWLDRVPQRAALHESVELVKRARKRSAAPFVNAVLRKLSTKKRQEPTEPYVSAPVLADAFAHPLCLVDRWVKEYGIAAAQKICAYNQSVPSTAIRIRNASADADLARDGVSLAPSPLLTSARRVLSGDITKSAAFRSGKIAIQDEGSQLVAALVSGNPAASSSRERTKTQILDCCAAPGGKTLAIADQNPQADITAIEIHPHRARLLQKFLPASYDHVRIQIVIADARLLPISSFFDRILADVPCSGTGTLARNPEIKWRLEPRDLTELQSLQIAILTSALERLTPGGRVIYSTCSLEREENEDVVEQVLRNNNSFRLRNCRSELDRLHQTGELTWPDLDSITRGPYLRTIQGVHPCDGFFAAIIAKTLVPREFI